MKRHLKLTKEDHDWADAVKTRDGWKCVVCGCEKMPNAHHMIARENHSAKLDLMNGLTLCPKHHFFSRQISAHNNPLGLWIWIEANRPAQLEYCREKMKEILKNDRN